MTMTAEDLLAGSSLTHEVDVPPELLGSHEPHSTRSQVMLRPLTVRDLQRIAKAAHDDEKLSASLIIQQGLVEPALKLDQVSQLPAGLARFLVDRINSISGISTPQDELAELVQAPLARACFVLAKEFGWTPEEISGMTIGQILLYLEMARGGGEAR
ncbi:hypothetical protein GS601_17190 [Myxacorys almedinensis A]|uniref:Uncharacterized protein n=2 Tax=Myxacorys TaxID=2056239 RepID=A0A8J7Z6K3_9CYAN|nr:hypothetical protein [Myxacorys almedinensis A]